MANGLRMPDGRNVMTINRTEMDILELRAYCLSLPLADEATPFDETTLVYRVAGKMFMLADIDDPEWINLKCDPDRAIELRDRYAEVLPGYHMNKRHWNTVRLDGDLPERFVREWIADSYRLVVRGLPKARQAEIAELVRLSGQPLL